MDSILNSIHRRPGGPCVAGGSVFEKFFAQCIDLIGECPHADSASGRVPSRFNVQTIGPCVVDMKCISLTRKIRRIEKDKVTMELDKPTLKLFIVEVVRLMEERIETIETVPVSNMSGKLAFSHYIAALVLMYGLIFEVIDDPRRYLHHRNEARKYNEKCIRIMSLPDIFQYDGVTS